ncbi:MAG: DUF3887 domain-containing protein [Actinomycetota bacterium]|nr:DUF3887 domain-containing protein [Actinomycetota bacterium]
MEFPALADLVDVDREVLALLLADNAEMLAESLRDPHRGARAVLASLGGTHRLRILLDDIVRTLAVEARGAGCTWAAIGEALQVTRQAAFQRFGGEDEETAMDPPAEAIPEARERAAVLLGQFFAGEWAEMRSGFSERMTEACPAELLDSVRSRLDAELGRLIRIRKPAVKVHGGHTVVDVPLVFERAVRTGRVAFDAEGRVSGFFVLLPQAAL